MTAASLPRLAAAAAVMVLVSAGAVAQQRPNGATDFLGSPPAVATGETVTKTFIDPNRRTPLTTSPESPAFLQGIAFNIALWRERAGDPTCPGAGSRVSVEGVHIYEAGTRAIVYYRVNGEPNSLISTCGVQRELSMVRFADGDWFVPSWGVRLARP